MKVLTLVPALALSLGVLAAPSAAQTRHTSNAVINGVATSPDIITLTLYAPPPLPCGIFVPNCPPPLCSATVNCNPGDTGATVAAGLAASLNAAGCGPGWVAKAIDNNLRVTGPPGVAFECCLSTVVEMGGAGLQLSGCAVNNVCDGVLVNEILAQAGGLQFVKAAGKVPATGPWAMVWMVLGTLTVGVGLVALQRRTQARAAA